ncbi:hypothetical protein [Parasulfitobacter algicola]|uniref:Uncharacterized protein n=1 Tax=Parasulfitobacter algicola TaxID=2614809 RepID=A0ABX2IU68_9RHOB|nr:hypothetical protein [Sulfitobacter algicola]NSX54610.1 hypothetical protein [Sulfitobacter algicola]
MPDLDTGHIFLTTLAPIKTSNTGGSTSFEQQARIALAKLPTALQSPATQNIGINSPFARNTRNHLARMFVLSDVIYNGRTGQNPVVGTIMGVNPTDLQKVDKLNAPYLVFCAEIDAITEDGAPLPTDLSPDEQKQVRAAYARKLWHTMEFEIQDVYSNCVGFENVDDADQFAAYLERCHVETTMPFHDYYLELPPFHNLAVKPLLAAVLVPAVIAILSLLMRVFGLLTLPWIGFSTLWTFVIAATLTVGISIWAIRFAIKNGEKPLAPGKYDDLPSVLKSLYLQQHFSDFVVKHQGTTAAKLHKDFGAFLKRHKPDDTTTPTQGPGIISSRPVPKNI